MQPEQSGPLPDRARSRRARWFAGAALVAAAGYAAPLFAPPPAVATGVPAPEWSLLERIVPGVAPGWVAARLLALVAAAGLLAAVTPAPRLSLPRAGAARAPDRRWLGAALAWALVHLGLTGFGGDPERGAQALHLVALFVPAWLLAAGSAAPPAGPEPRGTPWPASIAVLLVWLVATALLAHESPRAADAVDTWSGLETLQEEARSTRNLLRESALPGVPGTYLFLQGVAAFGRGGIAPRFEVIQAIHLAWLSAAALGVAWLAARLVSRAAAPVAVAAFLFSPFVSMMPFQTAPYFLGAIMTAALAAALLRFHVARSASSLAALSALLGIATAMPPVWPMAGFTGMLALLSFARGVRPPGAAVAVAAACGLAAAWPGLPGPGDWAAMTAAYTEARGSWMGLELMLLGQISPLTPTLWAMGAPGPIDIPLGALLSPFVVPRTPMRLWGDALFDPLGAALAAFGIAVALRGLRSGPAPWLLLLALAAALVPGFVSSFDRPSHTRMFTLPVPLALAAAVGFEALRGALAPRRSLGFGLATAAAIAFTGLVFFHRVTPPLLAQSSVGIGLRSLAGDEGTVHFLAHSPPADLGFLHVERMATALGRIGASAGSVDAGAGLVDAEDRPRADWFVWSPGLEQEESVRSLVCARWPGAAIYSLRDPAGASEALAARVRGGGWVPALPSGQWRVEGCRVR